VRLFEGEKLVTKELLERGFARKGGQGELSRLRDRETSKGKTRSGDSSSSCHPTAHRGSVVPPDSGRRTLRIRVTG
jgi:hypothetical protein